MSWQLRWWSGSYDTCLECKRLGFDPALRHIIFVPVGTHCYTITSLCNGDLF